jgi:zinc protease
MSARDFKLPPLSVEALPGGLQLVAIQRRGVPLFHARLSLPAGASDDPRGKAGLAQFTVDLLRRGTRARSADQVDELIEGMGASLGADCSMDEAALTLTVPAELRELALDALLEVALTPAFAHDEVSAAVRRALAGLQSDLDEPSTVAGRALVALGFGPSHPYGHPTHGYRRHVETFSRGDVEQFHAARYQRQGALLAVVGNDEPQKLAEVARAALQRWEGSWPAAAQLDASAAPLPPLPHTPGHAPLGHPLRALAIHKPDSTQAQIRIVAPGMAKSDARYAPAVVANSALGGAFTSVLVDAIRVDRGLSYSVSSRLLLYRKAGLSLFSSFTKNETLRTLIDVALEKMRAYAQSGPSAEALEKTRTYLSGLFPLGLESHEALAEQVADALLDGLGLQHLQTYRSRVTSVTEAQARKVAAQLSPARPGAQIIVVGDGEVAERALADLCPVEVRQLEEYA